MIDCVWEGDLADDCFCRVGDLLAHCECLGDFKWYDPEDAWWRRRPKYHETADYWYVGVYRVDARGFALGEALFHSGEPGGFIIGGNMARGIAEAVLKGCAR